MSGHNMFVRGGDKSHVTAAESIRKAKVSASLELDCFRERKGEGKVIGGGERLQDLLRREPAIMYRRSNGRSLRPGINLRNTG